MPGKNKNKTLNHTTTKNKENTETKATKLAQNLMNQVKIYKKAHGTDKTIKVILYFSPEEKMKVKRILEELGLNNEKYIVLIDTQRKTSASNVK